MRYLEIIETAGIERRPDPIAMSLFRQFGETVMPFSRLPPKARAAIKRYYEDEAGNKVPRNQPFGYVEIPTEAFVAAFERRGFGGDHGDFESFDAYHRWYVGQGDVPDHADVWPVLLDTDYDDIIWDGWHRFHSYVGKGLPVISAVLPIRREEPNAVTEAAVPGRGMLSRYGSGDCWHLATALHLLTGWPLKAMGFMDDTYGSPHYNVVHAMVQHPSGGFVDVRGIRSLDAVAAGYGLTDPRVPLIRDAQVGEYDLEPYRDDLRKAFSLILRCKDHFGITLPDADLKTKIREILADWPE